MRTFTSPRGGSFEKLWIRIAEVHARGLLSKGRKGAPFLSSHLRGLDSLDPLTLAHFHAPLPPPSPTPPACWPAREHGFGARVRIAA